MDDAVQLVRVAGGVGGDGRLELREEPREGGLVRLRVGRERRRPLRAQGQGVLGLRRGQRGDAGSTGLS
jgi:hypothetical protein